MSDKLRRNLIKYGVTAVVGGLMVLLYLWLNDFSLMHDTADRYKALANSFTVPGVIMVCVGALVWLTNEGSLRFLGYAAESIKRMLLPGRGLREREKYGDYLARKEEKGPVKGFSFLFWCGLGFIAVAVVFIVLYYSVE